MRIAIETVGSFSSAEDEEWLRRVFALVIDGWHSVAYPDPELVAATNYCRAHPMHFELLQKSYASEVAYASSAVPTVRVVATSAEASPRELRYTLDRAVRFLSQRLEVLVENRRNDGKFVEWYLAAVDPELVEMFSADNPPLTWSQGGGKDEIRQLVAEYSLHARERGIEPRLVVLCDGDAKFPGHCDGQTGELLKLCASLDIDLFVLEKRSIENYVSDRALIAYGATYAEVRRSVEFILGLSAAQRDHYPMKKGLSPDSLSEQEARLYGGIEYPRDFRPMLPRLIDFYLDRADLQPDRDDLRGRRSDAEIEKLVGVLRRAL